VSARDWSQRDLFVDEEVQGSAPARIPVWAWPDLSKNRNTKFGFLARPARHKPCERRSVLRDKPDRRVTLDRRARPRGGRRESDAARDLSWDPCDTCGSKELDFVVFMRGFEEYRCRRCGARLFRLRAGHKDEASS
jgi:hypothetical protein